MKGSKPKTTTAAATTKQPGSKTTTTGATATSSSGQRNPGTTSKRIINVIPRTVDKNSKDAFLKKLQLCMKNYDYKDETKDVRGKVSWNRFIERQPAIIYLAYFSWINSLPTFIYINVL